ncbi:hypothetical protein [Mycolicibacterium vinylchloridicum]|uniref:hypothetical protein n=1 Tax=Mycolicibacterium vinylchloridicum TaxID=2736928 RepID=UPI00022E36B9|nr:hypothetical protein [Mycolicibacterium vinylchloridicum]EHB46419.1 hypothetical protein MycrhDRAFT_6223 [Mycolicibacterium rhodesiae JS60]
MPIQEPPEYANFTARVMEICSTRAPWHRRLWRAGTLQIARELRDESVRPGTPESAIADLRKHCRHSLQTDNGIADRGQALGNLAGIKPGVTPSDHAWVSLREHLDRYDQDYLQTWAAAFDSPPDPDPRRRIDIEGASRRITAHLLDAGMHKSSVYAWLRTIRDDATVTPSIGDFLREADARLKKPLKIYTFCVPVQSSPRFDGSGPPPGWLTAQQTTQWKAQHAAKAPGVSQQGSFLIEVSAHDINTAADRARTRISNLATKLQLGAKKPIVLNPSMWSKDKGNEFPAHATNRLINVRAFERLGHLHDLDTVDYITNTLALVQAVQTGPPHVAVVNGWAAIESLMVGPADEQDVIAARRFALIVAASMLRAELTRLSRSYAANHSGSPADEMRACTENLDRAKLFQRHLHSNPTLNLTEMDMLALNRIRPALANPRGEIEKITEILTRELTRLYRKRNMIVHGGQIQEGSLHSLSETLAPLIGAGIDRVVHVGLKYDVPPIEMSAIAESRIHYLAPSTATDAGKLLELLEF